MKQSGQTFLPELNSSYFLLKILIIKPFDGNKLIAHCDKGDKKELKKRYRFR